MTQMFNGTTAANTEPNVADIVARVTRGEMVLVDVRGLQEVQATGKADGAVVIPLLDIPAMADPRHPECLDVFRQGKPVALYCATGVRSGKAAQMLLEYGHPEAVNIGGFKDWQAAGGAVQA